MTMRAYLEHKKEAMLMASNRFFLPSGMSADNVLAAYQFKGVSSEASALLDLSGHNRTLTKGSQTYSGTTYSPTWNPDTGFTFAAVYQGQCGYLDNSDLDAQNIKCAVVRFSDLTQTNRGYLVTAGGSSGTAQLMAACSFWQYTQTVDYVDYGEYKNFTGAGYVQIWSNAGHSGRWQHSGTAVTSGVLGANFGGENGLYVNGVARTTVSNEHGWTDIGNGGKQGRTFGNSHSNKSDLNNAVHAGKKIICAAFFSVALTADQHKEVADMMAEI